MCEGGAQCGRLGSAFRCKNLRLLCPFPVLSVRMCEYSTEQLPQEVLDFLKSQGNFSTKNARFRLAVCNYKLLSWKRIDGSGNCFFDAVAVALQAQCPQHREITGRDIRRDIVEFFRNCGDSTQDVMERCMVDIEHELQHELTCSNRTKFNGLPLQGFLPSTIEEYLDASAHDGVWIQGFHWIRAVAFLYEVRVGIVIYGHEVIRFIGVDEGITIFLYKVCCATTCVLSHCLTAPPYPDRCRNALRCVVTSFGCCSSQQRCVCPPPRESVHSLLT